MSVYLCHQTVKNMSNIKNKMAFTLAAAIRKNEPTHTLSTALTLAWSIVKQQAQTLALLTFQKKEGKIETRVVSSDWAQYYTPNGKGKEKPAGLNLFADIAKVAIGKPCIISTYQVINLLKAA
jgi:hypothetical protein